MKITWTPEARHTFYQILDFIQVNWSSKDTLKFVGKTDKILLLIAKNPLMFRKSNKKNIRIGLITKQTSVFYRVKPNEIIILAFWDNRQDVRKKHSL